MLLFMIGIAIGVAIGWTFPQPAWVTDVRARIKKWPAK